LKVTDQEVPKNGVFYRRKELLQLWDLLGDNDSYADYKDRK
jgi:hypothetical protein